MKTALLISLCLTGLVWTARSQTPVAAPSVSASPSAVATATISPVASIAPTVSPSATADEDIDSAIERKIRKHFNVSFDSDHHKGRDDSDTTWIAVPIVFIIFIAIFGTPVAIVGLIMYFSFSKSRAMHRTVRMLVEKGQPVPEALLNPPPVVRQRSDLRRGVVLLMVGASLMVFFGASHDWDGGSWSIGFIPFLIGLGYILIWWLDARKHDDVSPKV